MSELPNDPNLEDTGQRESTRPLAPLTPSRGTRRVDDPPEDDRTTRSSRRASEPRTSRQAVPRPSRTSSQPVPPPSYSYYPPPDPAYAPPPARRARARRDSGMYLPWWSLIIMIVVVGGLALGALLVVNTMGGQAAPGGSTPIIVVITATFTIGPPATPTPIPQAATLTPTRPLPTIAPSATLPPGNMAVGATVQIVGVGPSGLNVRSGPGKQFTAKFLAQDGQQYVVKDGPQTASDEEWWYIQDINNPNNIGWASRRFLTVIK
jgi:hypothetical protein